jgi:hypothetical protein
MSGHLFWLGMCVGAYQSLRCRCIAHRNHTGAPVRHGILCDRRVDLHLRLIRFRGYLHLIFDPRFKAIFRPS